MNYKQLYSILRIGLLKRRGRLAMKIIIMTGRFGMGYFVAAEAIQQKIRNSDIEADVEIVDWIQYITPNYADK
jgi:hypothetical protein